MFWNFWYLEMWREGTTESKKAKRTFCFLRTLIEKCLHTVFFRVISWLTQKFLLCFLVPKKQELSCVCDTCIVFDRGASFHLPSFVWMTTQQPSWDGSLLFPCNSRNFWLPQLISKYPIQQIPSLSYKTFHTLFCVFCLFFTGGFVFLIFYSAFFFGGAWK